MQFWDFYAGLVTTILLPNFLNNISPFSILQTQRRGQTFCVPSSAVSGSAAAAALDAGTAARTRTLQAAAAPRPSAGAAAAAVLAATAGLRGPTRPTPPGSSQAWERPRPSPAARGSRPRRRGEPNLYYR